MNRIILDCKGRLANQILCWANAKSFLSDNSINGKTIVINYPIDSNRVSFPGAVIESLENTEGLKPVTRNDIANTEEDCLWLWEDIWNFNDDSVKKRYIRDIIISESFEKELSQVVKDKSHIGLHIRYGDYVKIDRNNPPDPLPPFIREEDSYFLDIIHACKEIQSNVVFYMASDGTEEELKFITEIPGIICGRRDDPLFDLFELSRCKFVVGTNRSTFGIVASMYGDCPFIDPGTNKELLYKIISA